MAASEDSLRVKPVGSSMRAAPLLLLAALFSFGRAALADSRPARVGLDWQKGAGASDCIARDELEHAVEVRLGRDAIIGDEPADLLVRGRIERAVGRGWRASLEVRDAQHAPLGQRVIESEERDCRSLDGSLALVLALLVDTEVAVAPAEGEQRQLTPRETPLTLPPAPSPPWAFDVSAGAVAAVGQLPQVSFGPRVALGLRAPSVPRLLVDFAAWLPTRETRGDAGAEFWALSLGVALCPGLLRADALELQACVGQRIGRVASKGFGYDENRGRDSVGVAVEAGVRARVGLFRRLVLEAGALASLPLERDRYTFLSREGRQEALFRPSAVGMVSDLSVGAVFE